MNLGPGPGADSLIWDSNTETGFYGFVDPQDMFGYDTNYAIMQTIYDHAYQYVYKGTDIPSYPPIDYYNDCRESEASYNNVNYDNQWLKFRDGGKLLFIPVNCITSGNHYNLYQCGAMFGSKFDAFKNKDYDWGTGWPVGNTGRGWRNEYIKQSEYGPYNDYVIYESPSIDQDMLLEHPSGLVFRPRLLVGGRMDYLSKGIPCVDWNHPDFDNCTANSTGWGVGSEWNRLIYRVLDQSLISQTCRWDGDWGGPSEAPPFAEFPASMVYENAGSIMLPFILTTDDLAFFVRDTNYNPDYIDYQFNANIKLVLECDIDMGPVYRKFWSGFKGTEEHEVE